MYCTQIDPEVLGLWIVKGKQMKRQIGLLLAAFLVVGFFIAGCGGSTAKVTDTPEATVKPTPTPEPILSGNLI